MAELIERMFERDRDLPRIIEHVARSRASSDPHAFLHPGGLQWLLRKLGGAAFALRQWFDGDTLAGALIADSGYVIVLAGSADLDRYLWLLRLGEADARSGGAAPIEVSVWDDDRELLSVLRSLGYEPNGTYAHELVHELPAVPPEPTLPLGFSIRRFEPGMDDAFIEMHRSAWSTWRPSSYRAEMHAAVTRMPGFDRGLVPIIAAPDRTLAAYCLAWFDPVTRWVEIEPLATRPEFRRLGLGHAIVREVLRRSALRDASSVMVWGVGTNPEAVRLYESAGFRRRRVLREYRREPEGSRA
ncbi:MAG: GNAT family N-acetyltransferase [Candidatus Limnocylindria bacterium]